MTLTQISTAGVKDDAVTAGKIPANAVGSSELADSAITNAKVNASAAIAGTKIAPDFGSQNLVSTGTSNALGTTTIKGGSNAAARLLLQNTTSVRTNYIGLSNDDDRIVIAADDANQGSNSTIDFKVDGTERIRIDSSGNVLVGKTGTAFTSDGLRLDGTGLITVSKTSTSTIQGTANGASLSLCNPSNTDNNFSNIGFYKADGLVTSQINGITTNQSSRHGALAFLTHNGSALTERMRIDSSGGVGIGGTAQSGVALHVKDSVNEPSIQAGNDNIVRISASANEGKIICSYVTGAGYKPLKFFTSDVERLRLHTNGILSASQGIELGSGVDGTAANTLNDYEEGNYTAHFAVEGQSNMSMSGRVGKYVKVGKVVTVIGGGTVASISGQSSGNAIEFSNLPFAAANTSVGSVGYPFPVKLSSMSNSGIGNMNGNEPYQFIGRLNDAATSGRIEAIRSGSNQDPQNASLALTTNTQIQYMFTYITDA